MPKRVSAAKARASFKDVLTDIRRNGERIKITRYGRTAAWIVPPRDGEALETCREAIEACLDQQAAKASATPRRGTTRRKRSQKVK